VSLDRTLAVGTLLVNGRLRGCGFTLGPRLALTANHLVRGSGGQPLDAASVSLELPGGALAVERIEADLGLDVAVLYLADRASIWLPPGVAAQNARWQVITQPQPNDPLLDGRVTAIRRPFVNHKGHETMAHQLLVDTEADDYEGYSGSPVESPAGVVVGVLVEQVRSRLRASTADPKRALPLLYATPIEEVIERFRLESAVHEAKALETTKVPVISCQVIGIPVAYGLDVFRNRVRERELISSYLIASTTRLITIVGRRGIGKSALAAKVLDLVANGQWPHGADAPPPHGIVYISSRTTGITIERIFMDCARILGGEEEERLHAVWRNQRSLGDRIYELFSALSPGRFIILLDNLEDKLGDEGQLDEELSTFFDIAFRARHAPCILVTTQIPLALKPELLRFDIRINLVDGLPVGDAVELLRDLDRNGEAGIRDAPPKELAQAAERVYGIPRALELVVGAMADDYLTLPTLQNLLEEFAERGDVLANLVQERYEHLDAEARFVMDILAVFGRPVLRRALEWVIAQLKPDLDVGRALGALVRAQMVGVDRSTWSFALHPMDTDLTYGLLSPDGERGKRALNRRVADWYASEEVPEQEWRSTSDVTFHRYEFEHRARAGDFDKAARVLGAFDEFLILQGSVSAAVSMHLLIDGRLEDPEARTMHYLGFGIARIRGGPFSEAVDLLERAFESATATGDIQRQQRSLLQLGKAYRQQRDPEHAIRALTTAIEIARGTDDFVHEAHSLLGLCLTHCYAGNVELARQVADELDALVAHHPADDLLGGRAADARSIVCLVSQQWEQAIEAAELALVTYVRSGVPEAIGYVRNIKGLAHLALGRVEEAIQSFQLGRHEGSMVETIEVEGLCLFNLTWAYWVAGWLPETVETAREAADLLEEWGGLDALAARALAEAAAAMAAGEQKAAADFLMQAAHGARGNAELCPPAWFEEEARRLSQADADGS
jgi:tetratricopeptide (TPR) repeat protein